MSTTSCPHCGHSLTVRLIEMDGPAPRPSLRFEAGPGDLPIARPRPVSRGTGTRCARRPDAATGCRSSPRVARPGLARLPSAWAPPVVVATW